MKKEYGIPYKDIFEEIENIIHQRIIIEKKDEPLSDTLDGIINLSTHLMSCNCIALTPPDNRNEFFDDNFPLICARVEKDFKDAINFFKKLDKQLEEKENAKNQ